MAQKAPASDRWKALLLFFALFLLGALAHGQGGRHWIWISPDEIAQLPTSGPGWDAVLSAANAFRSSPTIVLADQDDLGDSEAMAAAMVWRKTGDESYRAAVEAGLLGVIGTEDDGFSGENHTSLEHARNVCATVIAADLIEWSAPANATAFRAWVDMIRTHERGDGRSIVSTHEDRPNNWGTHAGASRLACAIYLQDWKDVQSSVRVFGGWLGVRGLYASFDYGELCWQANPSRPVGINLPGSMLAGISVDGVLPDDQRRTGDCPPSISGENYVYEALQGVLAQAVMVDRLGVPQVWTVKSGAIFRAFSWQYDVAHFPASGDDAWQPTLINRVYGTGFAVPRAFGKAVGFTEWTCSPQLPNWP